MAVKADAVALVAQINGLLDGSLDPHSVAVDGLDPSVVNAYSAGQSLGAQLSTVFAEGFDDYHIDFSTGKLAVGPVQF